jgi:glycosyltransferase involved in cell wall biosynthesis
MPYVEYVRRGWKVKILTFDSDKIPKLPEGMEAICFPHHRLLWLLPWTHRELGSWADVIKTNQSSRAYYYTRAVKQWRKPILLRCGFVRGELQETTDGLTLKTRRYQKREARAFKAATHCQVPTKELSKWVQKRYDIPKEKISVVPNFVDTDLFKPMERVQKKGKSIISFGRLAPVKQFGLLINACAAIPGCTLTIIGEGSERQYLENLAKEQGVNLNLPGNLPNEELPKMLQEHRVFAITSIREGHPKALIEAMACGVSCIGVDAIGIQNVIKHGENGWLVKPTVQDIKDGIDTLLNDVLLSKNLGKNAHKFVKETFSFEGCFDLEYKNIQKLDRKYSK